MSRGGVRRPACGSAGLSCHVADMGSDLKSESPSPVHTIVGAPGFPLRDSASSAIPSAAGNRSFWQEREGVPRAKCAFRLTTLAEVRA